MVEASAGVQAAMNDPVLVGEYRKAGVYFDANPANSTRIAEDPNRYAELERALPEDRSVEVGQLVRGR